MVKQTSVAQIKLNKVTKAQFDAMEKNPNEFYMVTDAKLSYDDLDHKPIAILEGSAIPSPNWVPSTEYPQYPYHADLVFAEVTENDVPIVNFSMRDAISGNYAPVSEAFDGRVRIYAKQIPSEPTVISSIVCQKTHFVKE